MCKNIVLLGATGAIGSMCLDVLENQQKYKVSVITAKNNKAKLKSIKQKYDIPYSFLVDASNREEVEKTVNAVVSHFSNKNTLIINAIQGSSGLNFSSLFIEEGYDILLANKETLVLGGKEILEKAKKHSAKIIPLDTEMVALSHLIRAFSKDEIEEYIITASGGPFRNYTKEALSKVTFEDATKHPVWKMGKEISVDSATLLNKALEIAEASVLFDIDESKISVLIHPEGYVHSLVKLKNGMCYLELYTPNQRIAIADALGLSPYASTPLFSLPSLNFTKPTNEQNRVLLLGHEAAKSMHFASSLIKAKEEAFVLFKNGKISFTEIVDYVNNSTSK